MEEMFLFSSLMKALSGALFVLFKEISSASLWENPQ